MNSLRTPRVFVLALCALWLAGCASFQGAPPRPEAATGGLQALDKDYAEALAAYHKADKPQDQLKLRNQFIELRAGLIDRQYAAFRSTLYSQRVGSSVGVDIATMTLNIAGVLTPGEHAKTAANALSGGIIGSKASVDKNVYFDRTLTAMLSQMEGQRNEIRFRMLAGMGESAERYPLMQAAADLEAYYAAGTLAGAVTTMTQQAAVSEAKSAAALAARLPSEAEVTERLREDGFDIVRAGESDDANKKLMACVSPGGVPNVENRLLLRDWMKSKGLNAAPPFGLSRFLQQPEFAAQRTQAAADPVLTSKFKGCK